ncbi:hypothetical protein C7M84_022555 [Penaeus vannamei]|uniref:Uncharacterized protein n=1 Tax=Penaeus vannamei TaxID=6689 RepID=A0A423U6C0_PENVA|nr:hypothetical protein C7M84_022555 [Penaeus vannamei]
MFYFFSSLSLSPPQFPPCLCLSLSLSLTPAFRIFSRPLFSPPTFSFLSLSPTCSLIFLFLLSLMLPFSTSLHYSNIPASSLAPLLSPLSPISSPPIPIILRTTSPPPSLSFSLLLSYSSLVFPSSLLLVSFSLLSPPLFSPLACGSLIFSLSSSFLSLSYSLSQSNNTMSICPLLSPSSLFSLSLSSLPNLFISLSLWSSSLSPLSLVLSLISLLRIVSFSRLCVCIWFHIPLASRLALFFVSSSNSTNRISHNFSFYLPYSASHLSIHLFPSPRLLLPLPLHSLSLSQGITAPCLVSCSSLTLTLISPLPSSSPSSFPFFSFLFLLLTLSFSFFSSLSSSSSLLSLLSPSSLSHPLLLLLSLSSFSHSTPVIDISRTT